MLCWFWILFQTPICICKQIQRNEISISLCLRFHLVNSFSFSFSRSNCMERHRASSWPEDLRTGRQSNLLFSQYYYLLRFIESSGVASQQPAASAIQWMIQRNVSIKYNLPTKTVVKRFYKKFYIIASMNWKDWVAPSQNKNGWSQRKLMDWNMGGIVRVFSRWRRWCLF